MKMKLENIHQSEYFMCKGSLEAVLRCTKKFLTSFCAEKKILLRVFKGRTIFVRQSIIITILLLLFSTRMIYSILFVSKYEFLFVF